MSKFVNLISVIEKSNNPKALSELIDLLNSSAILLELTDRAIKNNKTDIWVSE